MNRQKIKNLYDNDSRKSEIHKKIKMSSSTLFNLINGIGNPTIINLEKVAKYFEKPVGYFFDEENLYKTETDENQKTIEEYKRESDLQYEHIAMLKEELTRLKKAVAQNVANVAV